jgi:phosphonate transport system substrate-binding protein
MMLTRRTMLAATAAATLPAGAAVAETWQAKYPELTFAVVPAENASGVTDRFAPFLTYLARQLGVKVTLRIANDYAAVIEGQRAGNVQIAYYGPASFSRALMTGVKTTAFVIDVNSDGSKGYYSVFYVMKDSPYHSIADLKGRKLALVDPNSTSGNNMPRYTLWNRHHILAEKYFSNVVFAGSHENAVIALSQGTADVCANWWNNADDSNLTRMLDKHMLKTDGGRELTRADFRIIETSPLIINSPYAYLDALPADMKAAIRTAFLDAAKNDTAAFAKLSDGKSLPWQPIDNAAYADTIKLVSFVDSLRKTARTG